MSYSETPPHTPEASAAPEAVYPEVLPDDERKQFEAVTTAKDYSEVPDDIYKRMLLNPWKDEEVVDLWADAREILSRDDAARQHAPSPENGSRAQAADPFTARRSPWDTISDFDLAGDLYKGMEDNSLSYTDAKRLLEERHDAALAALHADYTAAQSHLDQIQSKRTRSRPTPYPRTAAGSTAKPADDIVVRPSAVVAVSAAGAAKAAAKPPPGAVKVDPEADAAKDAEQKNGAAAQAEAPASKRAKAAKGLGALAAAAALRTRTAADRVKREFKNKDTRLRATAVAAGAVALLIGVGAVVASSQDRLSPPAAVAANNNPVNPGAARQELRPPVATKTELIANTHMNTVSEAALAYMNKLNLMLPAGYSEAQRTLMNLSDRVLVYNGVAGKARELPDGFMVELPDPQVYAGWVDQAKTAARAA